MTVRRLTRLFSTAAVATCAAAVTPIGLTTAAAAPCPDVQAVVARGTFEKPGTGGIGGDFANALRSKLGDRSYDVYAVDYPASLDFPTAVDGIRDAAEHVSGMAVTCPSTKLVLAGFSQGAAVIGFTTANGVPGGVDPSQVPKPMAASVADHVAAVVLLGKPDTEFMDAIDSPPVTVGPLYAGKTIELCAPGDPICGDGDDGAAHSSYTRIGMVDQAASFAAGRL